MQPALEARFRPPQGAAARPTDRVMFVASGIAVRQVLASQAACRAARGACGSALGSVTDSIDGRTTFRADAIALGAFRAVVARSGAESAEETASVATETLAKVTLAIQRSWASARVAMSPETGLDSSRTKATPRRQSGRAVVSAVRCGWRVMAVLSRSGAPG